MKNTTEKMSERVVNEKIRQQVKQSIGEVHTAGMKFLPKFTGKKIRHRNLSGRAKKNVDRVVRVLAWRQDFFKRKIPIYYLKLAEFKGKLS